MASDCGSEDEKSTASFIFLPDMRSSGKKLQDEIEQATEPHKLKDILWGATYSMCDVPFKDLLATTADTSQDAVDDPALGSCWFMTDNPIGADETATAFQWKQLSYSINWLGTLVDTEAAKVGRENVFIVGFGIGFGVATAFLLQMEEPIGGLLGVYPVMPFHVDLKYIALDGQTKAVVNSWSEMEKKRKEGEKRKAKGKEKMGQGSPDEAGAGSEVLSETLGVDNDNAQTHEARSARVMGFFQYLASNWEAPTYKRVCGRLDTSTPVVLLHGMDDEQVSFTYGKEAVQTFWNLGYKVKLDIKEDEGHKLSPRMVRELFNDFFEQGLGNGALRRQIQRFL